jgi:hypothetical protein
MPLVRLRISLVAAGCAAILVYSPVSYGDDLVDELHGSRLTDEDVASGCADDPLKIGGTDYVRAAIRGLGIGDMDVRFIGCAGIGFKISGGHKDLLTKRRQFALYYPTQKIGKTLNSKEYIAPVVHELSHVYQIERAGGQAKLRDNFCKERIELGADFITGFLFYSTLRIDAAANFQESLHLLGDYADGAHDSHARPTDRTGAFRSGYYMTAKRQISDLGEAYSIFQTMDFPWVATGYRFIKEKCK